MKIRFLTILLFYTASVEAQQVADPDFDISVKTPSYRAGAGPVIMIDEAHHNFHTASGRYKPFADLLRNDGYRVEAGKQSFNTETLDSVRVLVIANALHASNTQRWTLPTPSAFTPEEIAAVSKWVEVGGSLFLIADHMPFPGAAAELAALFGVEFINGFAMKKHGKDIFTPTKGLGDNPIVNGRNGSETITSLQTFTGQAFRIPQHAKAIVTLGDGYQMKIPETAWDFKKNTTVIDANGLVQGAYLRHGKGRVICFGEAAMFTAQRNGKSRMGMNSKSASQNKQFTLNCIHWLDGQIESEKSH